jgi:hypothetical protein
MRINTIFLPSADSRGAAAEFVKKMEQKGDVKCRRLFSWGLRIEENGKLFLIWREIKKRISRGEDLRWRPRLRRADGK